MGILQSLRRVFRREAELQTITPVTQQFLQLYRPFWNQLPDPDIALATDEEIYRNIQQDPVISFALDYEALLVAGDSWDVVPAAGDPRSAALVPFVKGFLNSIPDFTFARKYLAHASNMMGMAVMRKEVKVETRRLAPDLVPRRWVLLDGLTPVDKGFFKIEKEIAGLTPNDRGKTRKWWNWWDIDRLTWWVLEDRAVVPHAEHAVQDYVWFFEERWPDTNGYGRGKLVMLAMLMKIKSHLLQYRAAFCERWAQPWLLGKIDTTKGAMIDATASAEGMRKATDRIADMLGMLMQMQARYAAAIDANDSVDVIQANPGSLDPIESFVDYIDRWSMTAILGGNLANMEGSDGTGSYAQSTVHKEATEAKVAYRRTRVAETWREDVIRWWLEENHAIFAAMGLDGVEPPELVVKDSVKLPPDVAVQVLGFIYDSPLGEHVSVDDALEMLEVPKAEPGSQTIGMRPPPAPAGMPAGMGMGGDPMGDPAAGGGLPPELMAMAGGGEQPEGMPQ